MIEVRCPACSVPQYFPDDYPLQDGDLVRCINKGFLVDPGRLLTDSRENYCDNPYYVLNWRNVALVAAPVVELPDDDEVLA